MSIERFYLKNNLSFNEIELNFKNGLIVFSGPSGSGKSVLFESFLALFGLKEARAELSEINIKNSSLIYEDFAIDANDDINIKEIKKEKVRFLLNNQTISKNTLIDFSKQFIKYLHLKDASEFENDNLIATTDEISKITFQNFGELKNSFDVMFEEYTKSLKELEKISKDEANINDLKEYLIFEIKKIEDLNPKLGEYDELMDIKKKLSKKDKILQSMDDCRIFFDSTRSVTNALNILELDSSFFDTTINELTNIFEINRDKFDEMGELDIEGVLDRIEKLSSLNKRFGSIEEALIFKDQKKVELAKLENISFEKNELTNMVSKLNKNLEILASEITRFRILSLNEIQKITNEYLNSLFMDDANFVIELCELNKFGKDKIKIIFGTKSFDKLSSGEFNRLRLSYLSAISKLSVGSGILFLDEIDANLSGKESFAIAKVLKELSKSYQVFAISHQPQLSSCANQHFLVTKVDSHSFVQELDFNQRVEEISRMISTEDVGAEAKNFATKLLRNGF